MRRRLLFSADKAGEKPLPNEFTKLNYIQSSGRAYIKTDVIPQKTLTFKTVLSIISAGNSVIWGSRSDGNFETSKTQMYLNKTDNSDVQKNIIFVNKPIEHVNLIPARTEICDGTNELGVKYEIESGSSNLDDYKENATQPFYIFALNNMGVPAAFAFCRLYEFIVYNDKKVYRHYIPAQRNIDGVVGLFETVTQNFLTNAGTGKFIGG